MDDNANFNVPVDFTGVELWDPTKGGMNDPEPGAYAGKVTFAGEHTSKEGKKSIKVSVALAGAGETDLYLGLDFSKPSNKQKAATALASCGVNPAKLGLVKALTSALFMGQDGKGASCYVLVKLVDGVDSQGRKKLNDKEFATKEQFEAYKAAGTPARAASAPAGAPPANGAAPADAGLGNLFG